jgi:hypothetical protein
MKNQLMIVAFVACFLWMTVLTAVAWRQSAIISIYEKEFSRLAIQDCDIELEILSIKKRMRQD